MSKDEQTSTQEYSGTVDCRHTDWDISKYRTQRDTAYAEETAQLLCLFKRWRKSSLVKKDIKLLHPKHTILSLLSL